MNSCLTEIDDEVLDEAASDLYYNLNDRCSGADMRVEMPYEAAPAPTRELYRELALTVITALRRNYD